MSDYYNWKVDVDSQLQSIYNKINLPNKVCHNVMYLWMIIKCKEQVTNMLQVTTAMDNRFLHDKKMSITEGKHVD